MKEKLLGIGLTLLSVALFLGPIAASLSANEWNLRSTITPRQEEIDEIRNIFRDRRSKDTFKIENYKIDLNRDNFEIIIKINSPESVQIMIENFGEKLKTEKEPSSAAST